MKTVATWKNCPYKMSKKLLFPASGAEGSIHIGHWMNLSGVPVLFYPVMVITYVTIRPDSEPFQIRLVHVVKNFIAMQFGGQE